MPHKMEADNKQKINDEYRRRLLSPGVASEVLEDTHTFEMGIRRCSHHFKETSAPECKRKLFAIAKKNK